MKYAVIDLGGKQFIVEKGTRFHIEHKETPEPTVLFYRDGDEFLVGTPELPDVSVSLTKEADYKVKTDIGRFKSKSRYRRLKGHKQPMSIFLVEDIILSKAKSSKKGAKE